MNKTLFLTICIISNLNSIVADNLIFPNKVIPSKLQVEYQKMETIGFIHFTVNTFTDREWGYGNEDPKIFNPKKLDAKQWARIAKDGGLKELILTTKHHDGFCLWPSKYTEHSIKFCPYKNGNGDIVREFVDACREYDLKIGFYLSPWDRNHKKYGTRDYVEYYKNQLEELLSLYGRIDEIWFDGANGGDGFYGGANETREIYSKTYYDWDSIFKLVKKLQPEIMIFSDAGPDVHWIGNENGHAGETFWSTMDTDKVIIGNSDADYLNRGDKDGKNWVVGQCDVSIRPGWFYHSKEDNFVKTPQELIDTYYKSVGRNAVLLLNLPPNNDGLICDKDAKNLLKFKSIIDETFENNLALEADISATNYRENGFDIRNILNDNLDSFWAVGDEVKSAELVFDFDQEVEFDRILLQEPIHLGQRISKFCVEKQKNLKWERVYEGTTIGYKRLVRIPLVKASKIKISFLEANNTIAISKIGIFKASKDENI